MFYQYAEWLSCFIGFLTGQHLVQDDTQPVNITAMVNWHALGLFRTNVFRRANKAVIAVCFEGICDQLRQAEIREVRIVMVVKENVIGRKVAMNNAFLMSVFESERDPFN